MAGYSGTPLPKKLGIKPLFRIALSNMPPDVQADLKDALADCKNASDTVDFAMIFVKSRSDLKKQFAPAAKKLTPAGMLWVSWPKKNSGISSDLTEDVVREIGLDAGLVDVKVCAVNDVWSGLKFVRRLKDR
jgi:hypothetical protein